MVQDTVNTWATFRFALGYPDERHLGRFRELFDDAPLTLEELRALYIDLFEAGMPHPRCPLIEGYYLLNRPAGDVVLENKLYFKHFGLETPAKASPDHLLTQLEFLCWLDYCIESGNTDSASLLRARSEFVERHLAHWVPRAAQSLHQQAVPCYAPLFALLAEQVKNSKEVA
jgi:nitrate reductase assembly molybdenum cofactor insertion protein NarJ